MTSKIASKKLKQKRGVNMYVLLLQKSVVLQRSQSSVIKLTVIDLQRNNPDLKTNLVRAESDLNYPSLQYSRPLSIVQR